MFIFALLLLAPLVAKAASASPESLIYPLCLVSATLFVLQLWSRYCIAGSLFDPYTIFAIAAMLFNGSRSILELLGLNRAGIIGPQFSPQTSLTTIYLVTLGLWSYHIGGILGASAPDRRPLPPEPVRPSHYDHLRLLGWAMIAVAAPPSFLLIREAVETVGSHGYLALYQAERVIGLYATPQLLATLLVPGSLFVTAASKGKRFQLGVTSALIAVYALAELFLGARTGAAASLLPYVWLWNRCIRPLPKTVLVVGGILLVLIIFPLVRVTRSLVGEERVSPRAVMEAFYSIDNPAVAIISEMGGSVATVAYTVDLVPDSRAYDYGASYGLGALTVLPNLFWDVHPAIAKGTPNSWLIRTVDPGQAALGGGLGYSFIAEAYLNGGWPGVILICGLLGLLFAKLASSVSATADLVRIAFAATIVAFTLKYARSDCTEVIRFLTWFALAPYALARALTPNREGQRYTEGKGPAGLSRVSTFSHPPLTPKPISTCPTQD